jgi:protein HIRA/HIR1
MFARLNSRGRLVVAMSNGDGFSYNPDMLSWQRLSESWWAVGSQYWNTTDTSVAAVSNTSKQTTASKAKDGPSFLDEIDPENISAGIIPLLERNTTSQALVKGRAFFLQRLVKQLLSAEGFEGFESAVSVAHLENRLAAALSLLSKDEFRVYLIMYAKRIGAEGLRGKVEELLRGLMGRVFDDDDADAGIEWKGAEDEDDEIVGWKRSELLREVVMVLGKHRDLQRLTVPYSRYLEVLDTEGDGTNGEEAMVTDG